MERYEIRKSSDNSTLAQLETPEELRKWYAENAYFKNGYYYLKSDDSSIYQVKRRF